MKRVEDRARAAQRKRRAHLEVEILEPRNLPSATVGLFTNAIPLTSTIATGPDALDYLPPPSTTAAPSSGTGTTGQLAATVSLTSVPALNSLPGARDSIWLNFSGDNQAQWGSYSNISTPAFDQDGDPTTFSAGELQTIQQIWQVVAEDYAPFNINVTTVKPTNLGHGFTQQVDVGGNGSWTGATYGGISYVGSFAAAGIPNISYVFSANLNDGDPIDTGDAISHEVGHSMGLSHQSTWNADGTLNQEYNPGNAAEAPIMGYAYSATRAVWWDGTSEQGPSVVQDDMAVIASATNGFGYRPEPSNISAAAATPLTMSGSQVTGAGIILHTTDHDFYSFATTGGQISIAVNPVYANDLAPTITLLGPNGQTVLASNDPSPNFNATITTTVAAGTYYVEVGSHGSYGDVGQYTINGTIATGQSAPNAPASLTANAGDGQVSLSWNTVAGATSYNIYRGTGSGSESLLVSGVTGTSYTNTGLTNGTTYYYQVTAVNSVGESGRSGETSANPLPLAGGGQGIAIDAGGSAVGSFVADTDFSGGTAYSTGDTINTAGVTNAPPQSVFQTERYGNFTYTMPNLTPGASYTVRLDFAEIYWTSPGQRLFNVSINGQQVLTNFDIVAATGGKDIAIAKSFTATADSSGDIAITFTSVLDNAKVSAIEITPTIPVAPSTPTGLTATATAGQVALSWNGVAGATNYNVYRSTSSGSETLLVSGLTGTSYTNTGLANGTTYYYQVIAVNSVGQSGRSSEANGTPQAVVPASFAIDAGGGAVGSFVADTDFSGGTAYSTGDTINTSAITNAPPQSVFQTERYGNFSYTMPNLTPGASYTVRLDFAEIYWSSPGQRLFNVSINGQQVLTNFDIVAAAGGKDIAIARSFTATADSSGHIATTFTSVLDNAKVSAIEIAPISGAPAASQTPAPQASSLGTTPANLVAALGNLLTGNTARGHHSLEAIDAFFARWGRTDF